MAPGIAQRGPAAGSFGRPPPSPCCALPASPRDPGAECGHAHPAAEGSGADEPAVTVVLSDLTGVTGQHIIRAIVAARPTPTPWRSIGTRGSGLGGGEHRGAHGHYRPEHVFVLRPQNLSSSQCHQQQLAACDAAIEAHLATLAPRRRPPPHPLPPAAKRSGGRRQRARFDLRTPLHQLTGVPHPDRCLGPYSALRLLAGLARTCVAGPREALHLWLTWRPANKISAPPAQLQTMPSPTAPRNLRLAALSRGGPRPRSCLLSPLGLPGGQG